MENNELICFQMISHNGNAKSCYIEAIECAKRGEFALARERILEGKASYIEGHKVHAKLIQSEAMNQPIEMSLLLIHAEDQMMSSEVYESMAQNILSLNEEIKYLKDLITNA